MRTRLSLAVGALVATRLLRPIGEEADDLTDDDDDDIKAREQRVFDADRAYAIERGYLPSGSPDVERAAPVTSADDR